MSITKIGLRDLNGKEIKVGDRIRFFHADGCIWDATVTFEDGVSTVNAHDAVQVSNPTSWNRSHDWLQSRLWSCLIGYPDSSYRHSLCYIADHSPPKLKVEEAYKNHGKYEVKIIGAVVL